MSQAGTYVPNGGGGGGTVITLTGNTGGPVGPDGAGNINLIGTGNIIVTGLPIDNELDISLSGSIPSEFDTDAGTATPIAGVLNILGGTGINTSGASDTVTINLDVPVSIADGGTNATSMTDTFGVNYFDGTRIVTTAVGTAGDVLTSNGVGVAPTFQTPGASGVISITGDTGSAVSGAITLTGLTLSSGIVFNGTTATSLETTIDYISMTDANSGGTTGFVGVVGNGAIIAPWGGIASGNMFIGPNSGSPAITGSQNIGIGQFSLNQIQDAINNIAIGGGGTAQGCISLTDNIAIGYQALASNGSGGLTGLAGNVAIGSNSIRNAITSAFNVALGYNSGLNYTGAESSNILISNEGVVGESNVTRIGTDGTGDGEQEFCYIAGVYGTTGITATRMATVDSNGLMGSAALPGGSGVTTITGDAGSSVTGAVTLTGGTSGVVFTGSGGNTLTVTSLGTTNHEVQVGNTSGTLTGLTVGTNGQVLVGSTTANPVFATLGSNGSLSYTTGAGTLSIAIAAPVSIANGGTNATSMTNTDGVVYYDGTRLVTTTVGSATQVLTSNGPAVAPTFQSISASGALTTLNGDSGSATPTAGAITIAGGHNITTSATASTVTVNVSGTTNHAVQVGNSTNSLTSLTVGTNGQVLLGSTSADPVFATLTSTGGSITYTTGAGSLNIDLTSPVSIAHGGTNATSMTNTDGVVYYDGTRLVTTTVGTAGQILTSNGAGVAPTFQTGSGGGGVTSITGNSGGAQTGAITLTGGTSGALFAGSAGTITESFNFLAMPDTNAGATVGYIKFGSNPVMAFYGGIATKNMFIGNLSGNASLTGTLNTSVGYGSMTTVTTGSGNTCLGGNTMSAVTDASFCTAVGYNALHAVTDSNSNTAIGEAALQSLTSTTGDGLNTAVGVGALFNLVSGVNNIAMGNLAGDQLTTNDSNNIIIGDVGVAGDNQVIRIGALGTQTTCYIQGIDGASIGITSNQVFVDSSNGQLGTNVSSRRYKENIQDIGVDSRDIMKLRPTKFSYKKDPEKTTQYGLIAEEVQEVMPYLVSYDKEGAPHSVRYHELPTLLLAEIQRLEARIKSLEEQFAARVR